MSMIGKNRSHKDTSHNSAHACEIVEIDRYQHTERTSHVSQCAQSCQHTAHNNGSHRRAKSERSNADSRCKQPECKRDGLPEVEIGQHSETSVANQPAAARSARCGWHAQTYGKSRCRSSLVNTTANGRGQRTDGPRSTAKTSIDELNENAPAIAGSSRCGSRTC
jgi:hypothetical protein